MNPSDLPGRAASPWLELEHPERPALDSDRQADVAVVGGGIVGLTAALLLRREGVDVVVLEAGQIGQGVTGRTTAKLSSLHGLTYASLLATHGEEKTRTYAQANEAGIGIISGLVEELSIDCDLRRKDNFTYTEQPESRGEIEEEVSAAQAAGLSAELVEITDLPFPIAAAIRLPDQAEFHPVRYLLGVAEELDRGGQRVFERTRVTGVGSGKVATAAGPNVEAERVILATHLPILDRGGHFALVEPERSYALGVRLEGTAPQGMYLSADSPSRSLRAHPLGEEQLLVVGGQSARMGSDDPAEAFLELARFARERFAVREIEYRWSAHDYMPADELPLVGSLWPMGDGTLFATGMKKWGLAMGAAAARILTDSVAGRENPWARTFGPRRLPALRSLGELAKHNAQSGMHFVGDRIKRAGAAESLGAGEGAIADAGLAKTALFRDDAGELHAMSARCTHLGCLVEWNRAERTWDCPCHGSRYAATGEVIDGPAIHPLAPKDPP